MHETIHFGNGFVGTAFFVLVRNSNLTKHIDKHGKRAGEDHSILLPQVIKSFHIILVYDGLVKTI